MKKCVICGTPLDGENKSKEHIIHNAIGGCLEDDGIYCRKCNGLYGTEQDKAFIQIFAPIVDRMDIHKTRKTKGTSYTGAVYDKGGNLYTARYKDGKIVELYDADSKYVHMKRVKTETLGYDFELDNETFRLGLSKIAFNYAIHCGLDTGCLEKVFDNKTKELIRNPLVIPFLPMTIFDLIMEMHPVKRLFHVVRIFNDGQDLYAYIELFNTFQFYVLLSEKYNFNEKGNIDESYGNLIEKNPPLPEGLQEALIPKDYKDADIMVNQYHIDMDQLMEDLKNCDDYDSPDRLEQENLLFTRIGKNAYEQIRKQSYHMDYKKLLKQHYDSIDFTKEIPCADDKRRVTEFFSTVRYYTVDDGVNLETYKKFLPECLAYPKAVCNILNRCSKLDFYGYLKFDMLTKRLN